MTQREFESDMDMLSVDLKYYANNATGLPSANLTSPVSTPVNQPQHSSQAEEIWDGELRSRTAMMRDPNLPACKMCKGAGMFNFSRVTGRDRLTMCNRCMGTGNGQLAITELRDEVAALHPQIWLDTDQDGLHVPDVPDLVEQLRLSIEMVKKGRAA